MTKVEAIRARLEKASRGWLAYNELEKHCRSDLTHLLAVADAARELRCTSPLALTLGATQVVPCGMCPSCKVRAKLDEKENGDG